MDQHWVWLIILLVVGVVVSNLMVLKYSAKFKWPSNRSTDTSNKEPNEQDKDTADKS